MPDYRPSLEHPAHRHRRLILVVSAVAALVLAIILASTTSLFRHPKPQPVVDTTPMVQTPQRFKDFIATVTSTGENSLNVSMSRVGPDGQPRTDEYQVGIGASTDVSRAFDEPAGLRLEKLPPSSIAVGDRVHVFADMDVAYVSQFTASAIYQLTWK